MANKEVQDKGKKKGTVRSGIIYYPVGDFIIRVKNAAMARRHTVVVPKTELVKSVANTLIKEGYLDEVKEEEGKLSARLTYRKKEPVLINLKVVSKPGLRVYMGVDGLEKIKSPSIFILSTPKGVMSSKEAIKKRLGGEVIAEIW